MLNNPFLFVEYGLKRKRKKERERERGKNVGEEEGMAFRKILNEEFAGSRGKMESVS